MNFKTTLVKRIIAMFIDLSIVGGIGALLGFMFEFLNVLDFSFEISILILLLKDLYNTNGSLGKNILKLKVQSSGVGTDVTKLYRILRNITLAIYPIELIIAFFNQGKRIGDLIFKTEVIEP